MTSRRGVLVLGAFACAACAAQPDVSSVGPEAPLAVAHQTIEGPYVPEGSTFAVRLDQAIDTFYTPPGTPFTGSVMAPIQSPDGSLVVAAGAKVRGTLASVGSPDAPLIRVQLDRIDTVAGSLPLHASVRSAEHFAWRGPPTPDTTASYVFPYGFTDYGSDERAPADSSQAEGRALMQPREIRVPAGAVMRLELVDPLVLPGAQLAH